MKAVWGNSILAGLILVTPQLALAKSKNAQDIETPAIVQKLFECRTIEDPTERLACFDSEVAAVHEAREKKDLLIADREQVKETRKGLFGFTLPKIGLFKGDGDDEEVKEISSSIARFGRTSGGRVTFSVEGGARWTQIDNTPVLGTPEVGDPVTIEKASLGSYKAKIGTRRAIRVKRVD